MAVTVTNTPVLNYNTVAAVTKNAATADVDGTAEVFTITPTRANQSCALIIGGVGSGADGDIGVSVAAGDMWAGGAVTATVTKNTEAVIQLETAKVMKKNGTIAVTLTPATTDKLKTDHSAYVKFVELR
jgi:hypothetical protein